MANLDSSKYEPAVLNGYQSNRLVGLAKPFALEPLGTSIRVCTSLEVVGRITWEDI